jgi:DNA-binding GntR family transcriptional regulator
MPRPDLVLVAGGRPRAAAPGMPPDLCGLYRLRRLIEPELSAQSCLLIPSAELDRLEAHIPFSDPRPDHVCAAHRAFHLELLRPAATRWDLRVLRPLWSVTDDLIRTLVAKEGRRASELIRTHCLCGELITAYRTRDPRVARSVWRRYLHRSEKFVRRLGRALG